MTISRRALTYPLLPRLSQTCRFTDRNTNRVTHSNIPSVRYDKYLHTWRTPSWTPWTTSTPHRPTIGSTPNAISSEND